jgi:integration host factor subunit alpha
MSVTKQHLFESISSIHGFSKRDSAELIDAVFEIIKGTLESGEDVLISGFGKFCVKEKRKRRGRNPQTGEELLLEGRRIVTFRCSPVLRDRINGKKG